MCDGPYIADIDAIAVQKVAQNRILIDGIGVYVYDQRLGQKAGGREANTIGAVALVDRCGILTALVNSIFHTVNVLS